MSLKVTGRIEKKAVFPMVICICIWLAAFIFLANNNRGMPETASILSLLTIQLISSILDLCCRTIPVKSILSILIIWSAVYLIGMNTGILMKAVLGAGSALAVMLLILLISRGQIGGGDVVLMTATGFFAGAGTCFAVLFLATIASGIFSLTMIAVKKGNKASEIPFAPFILVTTSILSLL